MILKWVIKTESIKRTSWSIRDLRFYQSYATWSCAGDINVTWLREYSLQVEEKEEEKEEEKGEEEEEEEEEEGEEEEGGEEQHF